MLDLRMHRRLGALFLAFGASSVMSVTANSDSALGPHLAVLKNHAGSFGSECWLLQGHFLPGKYNRDPWESCDNYVQTEYGRVEMPLLEPEMDGRYFQVRGIPYFWGIATVCDHPAPIALEPHSYAPCLGDTLSPTFRLSWGEVKGRFLRQQQVRAK